MFITGVTDSFNLVLWLNFKRPESKKKLYHQEMIYKSVTLSV